MVSKSFDINTEGLLPFEPSSRRLVLELSPDTVSVILWQKEKQLPEAVEVFNGHHTNTEDWQAMLQQSKLLNFNQVETLVVHAYPYMLPIPAFLYTTTSAAEQLALIHGTNTSFYTGGDVLERTSMVVAWQLPLYTYQFLRNHFYVLQVKHVVSGMIEAGKNNNSTGGNIIVYGNTSWVVLWQDGELQVAKFVSIGQADDLSYHLLNTCKQFELDPAEVNWEISGMAAENSPLWNAVTRFFEPVKVMPCTVPLPEELQPHYFAHLFRLVK